MRSQLLAAAAVGIAAPALAQVDAPAGVYNVDPNHASIHWRMSHFGLSNYTARFDDFTATIELDPDNPENSSMTATIDPASLNLDFDGPAFKEELLNDPRFFRVEEFPEITFQSTSVELTGDDTGTVTGDLTFLGQSHPLTLDVTLNGSYAQHPFTQRGALGISATGIVDRTMFGMDYGVAEGTLGGGVEVIIEAEFHQAAE